MWIFMPNWCEGIILLRDGAPGLWYESLGASQSDMSKPRSNAWLHSGVWMLYQYQSEIYYLWKIRRNILLLVNRRFYFWDCLFFYSIRSPVVWLWLWQKADGVPREQPVVQWLSSGNISVLCGPFLWCAMTEAFQDDVWWFSKLSGVLCLEGLDKPVGLKNVQTEVWKAPLTDTDGQAKNWGKKIPSSW